MTTLVVAEIPENAERDLHVETEILGADIEVRRYAHTGDSQELAAACRDADVILTDYAAFTQTVIDQLEHCRLISVSATGYSCIDVAAAADAGISVCAIDEYCTDEVADHTMLLLLALCRRLTEYQEQVQTGKQWRFDSLSGLRRLSGMTLGIIGFGRIGQAVARRAKGFGMTIIAVDPFADSEDAARHGARFCELDELLAESDVISLHCSLSSENEGLIDAAAFEKMQKRPVLINCARGGLVDEEALAQALDAGRVSGAGLDVLADESPDLERAPLAGRANVILTPHVAFYSDASILENRRVSVANIRHFLDGKHELVRKFVHRAGV